MQDQELPRERITHDLMNQLGIIVGFAELLLSEIPGDDPRRADIEEMHSAANRAIALVDQLDPPGLPPSQNS